MPPDMFTVPAGTDIAAPAAIDTVNRAAHVQIERGTIGDLVFTLLTRDRVLRLLYWAESDLGPEYWRLLDAS